jgi:hypothetical protein
MDSTKNLQMKLQAPNSDETIFEFEKNKRFVFSKRYE